MLSYGDFVAHRMVNQRLWGKPFKDLNQGVSSLCAVQSQEFPYAKWTVAQRCEGTVTEAEVDQALADGTILRTHVLRPTWHFVTPQDIWWLLELTGPRVQAIMNRYYGANGVLEVPQTTDLFAAALEGGKHLARGELRAVLEHAGITLPSLGFNLALMRAELDGVICSGAPRGKQQTYALLSERAPNALRLSRDESLAEIVRRYFTTRSPATLKDFSWWSGLTQADGKLGLSLVGDEISSEVVNGRTFWYVPSRPAKVKEPRIDLVQMYDEIGMSYSESREALADPSITRVKPLYYHTILLNGRLVGHWRRTVKGNSVTFETHLLRTFTRPETAALEAAQSRFRTFAAE